MVEISNQEINEDGSIIINFSAEEKIWVENITLDLRDKLEKSELTKEPFQSLEVESQEPVPESWP